MSLDERFRQLIGGETHAGVGLAKTVIAIKLRSMWNAPQTAVKLILIIIMALCWSAHSPRRVRCIATAASGE